MLQRLRRRRRSAQPCVEKQKIEIFSQTRCNYEDTTAIHPFVQCKMHSWHHYMCVKHNAHSVNELKLWIAGKSLSRDARMWRRSPPLILEWMMTGAGLACSGSISASFSIQLLCENHFLWRRNIIPHFSLLRCCVLFAAAARHRSGTVVLVFPTICSFLDKELAVFCVLLHFGFVNCCSCILGLFIIIIPYCYSFSRRFCYIYRKPPVSSPSLSLVSSIIKKYRHFLLAVLFHLYSSTTLQWCCLLLLLLLLHNNSANVHRWMTILIWSLPSEF